MQWQKVKRKNKRRKAAIFLAAKTFKMCLNPKWIYKKGFYKEANYRGFQGEFYEIGTYSKCGACEVCIAEKANNWVVRNYYEEKAHKEKCFITLTYEDSPLILVRKDLQDFMKRLRRYFDYHEKGRKIRMYGCGEYGTINGRPHMHVIIYGWHDSNPKYLTINKKKQIVYQSTLIQSTWGLGRTSYQDFSEKEIPYISLYDTPKETFKRAYKLNREKIKKLERIANQNIRRLEQRRNTLIELDTALKELEKSKEEYYLIKEFNCWSLALGWEEFEKEYYNSNNYTWTEYIEDKEFVTPSPWVKKLANAGDIAAAEEMFKREREIVQAANEEEERSNNYNKIREKRKKDHLEWHTGTKNEVIL